MRRSFKKMMVMAVAATIALAGCSSSSSDDTEATASDEPFRVVAFTSGNQTPIGAWWISAVEAKAEELGWDLTMIQGDFDFQKMNPAVESAIGQGADAVFDGYTDYSAIGSIITAAQDADIPIFAIDAGTEPTDGFVLNITTNQQGIVDQTLGAISDQIGGLEGKTIMVIGHDPHPGIRMRSNLALNDLEAAGATIAGGAIQQVVSPASGRTEALALVSDFLIANPDGLDAVWVGWDDAALGAAQAITEAGSSAVVTGVDAIAESIASIESGGALFATIEQPWPSINDDVMAALEEYQINGTLPTTNFSTVDTTLVNAANAADITPSDQLG